MNIADLFVRVRGDTSDVTRQLKNVEGSLIGVERASASMSGGMSSAHLSTGKLRQELVTLVRQATGTAPVIAQLGTVVSEFALGGALTLGVTAGIAAIAFAYNKLTEGARKAREEQQKLADALISQFQPKTGPRSQTNKEFNAALKERVEITKELARLQRAEGSDLSSATQNKIASLTKRYQELTQGINDAMMGSITSLDTVVVKTDSATKAMEGLHGAAQKVAVTLAEIVAMPAALSGMIRALSANTLAQANETLFGDLVPKTDMPTISKPFDDLTDSQKDQLRQLGVIADNTSKLGDIISSSAIQGASIIVSALNIGGGGRGSGLGGALGSTAGFALGMFATGGSPIGGAIGSTLGNIVGSLFGGLFDHHKKAVDNNTQAVRALTEAMLLNLPSGYKVAEGRFNASDPQAFRSWLQRYATRGGAPLVVTP